MVLDLNKIQKELKSLKSKKDKKEKDNLSIKSKVTSRNILRPSQASLTIKEYNAPSVLNDPNRFFRSEMEETKKSLFFS